MLEQALRQVERIKPADLTAGPGLTVDPTFQALAVLAQLYAAVPGPRRVIWVTH